MCLLKAFTETNQIFRPILTAKTWKIICMISKITVHLLPLTTSMMHLMSLQQWSQEQLTLTPHLNLYPENKEDWRASLGLLKLYVFPSTKSNPCSNPISSTATRLKNPFSKSIPTDSQKLKHSPKSCILNLNSKSSSLFICPKVYTIHKRKINTIQKTGQGDCEGTVRSSSQAATLKTKLLFLIAGNSMVAVCGQS